jgi:hypothetical protein
MNNSNPTSLKSSNIIDMVLCSDSLVNKIAEVTVDNTFTESDHWPVRFKVNFVPGSTKVKQINWQNFKVEVDIYYDGKIASAESEYELDKLCIEFSKQIRNTLEQNTLEVELKSHRTNTPKELLELLKSKKQLQNIYKKSHDPVIKNLINNVANKIKRFNRKLLNEK